MSQRDYYEVLGLTPEADGAMVDQAYWHLARKYQSMAGTDPRARLQHDELNEAYGVLGTPRLREEYDRFRDDLVTRGMIRPVRSGRTEQEAALPKGEQRSPRRLPHVQHWRTYATSAVIVALALAAAWQSVNLALVTALLVTGLAFSLTPALRWRSVRVNIRPRRATGRGPHTEAPEDAGIEEEHARAPRRRPDDADALRDSTAAMIGRWRRNLGLRVASDEAVRAAAASAPCTELVEIVESEREIAAASDEEPLAAVLEILRGSRRHIESR